MRLLSAARCLGKTPALLLLGGLMLPVEDARAQYVLTQTFNNPTPEFFESFGYSVAIDGNQVLIGAPFEITGAPAAGSAYLFDATTGALLQTFNNPMPESGDFFGDSVAIDSSQVLIGAPQDNTGADLAGSAYLFDALTGTLQQTFNNPTPDDFDYFGRSVAIAGNQVLIGAPGDKPDGFPAGSAHLFNAVTGTLLQTFNNPSPEPGDLFGDAFGTSVAIEDNRALIGASRDNEGADSTGSAYLFDPTTGALQQTFNNPTPDDFDFFGSSVAIDGNRVLIGAPGDNTGTDSAGSAYLFNASTGVLQQTLNNPTVEEDDSFGSSVAIDGNQVLIGAPGDNTGDVDAGSAYLFNASTGDLQQTFNNPTPEFRDFFGRSVAIDGNQVLIGADGDNTGADFAGSAYLYSLRSTTAVPAPLPLFAVAGAFGWSRRLRRRLNRSGA